jgi:predicted HicB family RNase H-like nuclease
MKTKLVHVRLDPDRIIALCVEAKRRGISVDEFVSEAVARFLEE